MQNLHIKLHDFQKALLKKLAGHKSLRFNQLHIDELTSEHMNYHLKELIKFNLVAKEGNEYMLTDAGKDYSNLMDNNVEIIEKQPKTSVLLRVIRERKDGEVEHLLSRRLRQPYLGKVGRLTGKVRFGETITAAAKRELYEETGLVATEVVLEEVYHKLRHNPDEEYIQDVIFYTCFIKNPAGELITHTPHQENLWATAKTVKADKSIDAFDDLTLDDNLEPHPLTFEEHDALADGF